VEDRRNCHARVISKHVVDGPKPIVAEEWNQLSNDFCDVADWGTSEHDEWGGNDAGSFAGNSEGDG